MKLQKSITKKFRSSRVKTLDVHPSRNVVACGLYNGYIQTWDTVGFRMLNESHVSEFPIRTVKIVEKNDCVLIGTDEGKIHIYDLSHLRKIQSFDAHCDFIRKIEVHPTQEEFLTCSDDGTIKRWKFGKDIKNMATYVGHSHFVMDVKYYPKDTRKFISCSLDGTIKLWDTTQVKPLKTYKGHINGINAICFIPNEDYFVSASDDLSLKVWEIGSSTSISTLTGHSDNINSLFVFNNRIVSTSEDGSLKFWDSKTFVLKDTLSLNSGRVWEFRDKNNTFIIGTDEDLVFMEIKSGSILSSLKNNKIFYVIQNKIFSCKLEDLHNPKLLSELDHFPSELAVSENGKSIALVGNNSFSLYSSLGFRKKMTCPGTSLSFISNTEFLVLDGDKINFYNKSEIVKCLKVEGLSRIFYLSGDEETPLIVGVFEESTTFYDLNGKSVGHFDFPIKAILQSGDFLVAIRENDFVVLRRDSPIKNEKKEGDHEKKEGDHEFTHIKELNYKIQSYASSGNVFVFNSGNSLSYLLLGNNPFVSTLTSSTGVVTGVGDSEIFILEDSSLRVVPFDSEFINFQLGVLNNSLSDLDFSYSDAFRLKAISFYESLGLHDKALEICTNENHKFEILLKLDRLEEALAIADSPMKFQRLGRFFMKSNLKKAADCFYKGRDFRSLLFVDLLSEKKYLKEVSLNCYKEGFPNYSFIASLKGGDFERSSELLKESPFYEIFKKTYNLGK